jgi:hypothetical protein
VKITPVVNARSAVVLVALLAACSADRVVGPIVYPPEGPDPIPPPTEPGSPPVPLLPPVRLTVPTYDGSGQVVHPDVLVFDAPWRGATYWMGITPYPGGNASYENPSILMGGDGVAWQPPDGLTNPVVPRPTDGGYNSDPDLVYDAEGDRLVLVYREVLAGRNILLSKASADGRAWTPASVLLSKPSHGAVSPTVTFDASGRPMLWYVDSGPVGCNATSSTVRLRIGSGPAALLPAKPDEGWSGDVATDLALADRVVWHLDVIYVPARAEYWAVFHAFEKTKGCGSGDLYLARSRDGVRWTTYPTPILTTGNSDWTGASLYRSSIVYDAGRDVLRVWFSARATTGRWSAGLVEFAVSALLRSLGERVAA